jgi:hypothetical protein
VETNFDVAQLLIDQRSNILAEAEAEVAGRRLPHYQEAGTEETAKRLAELFDVVVASASSSTLESALAHADHIAADRQQSGHDLFELQRAINALEEQLWHAIMRDAPADVQGYALGVVSTVLGAIKDRVACAFVSKAAEKPTRTLRLDELFRGTA